jgi:hypothetical protein
MESILFVVAGMVLLTILKSLLFSRAPRREDVMRRIR